MKALVALCFLTTLAAVSPVRAQIDAATQEGDLTCWRSDGTPNHEIGRFPNRANPNAFRAQTLRFCVPTKPEYTGVPVKGLMTVGVALNGVPIRPFTAGYYDPNGRRGIGRTPSDWRQQAMHEPRRLGMDHQNGHVDRSGLYHYHSVAPALETQTLIGYAPDGFEIHYDPSHETSSWQLKSGDRPTAPFGAYTGAFEEDFAYVAGTGTLDACNGRMVDGTYTYFATDTYPYFPRCFKGKIVPQFMTRR